MIIYPWDILGDTMGFLRKAAAKGDRPFERRHGLRPGGWHHPDHGAVLRMVVLETRPWSF